MSELSIVAAGPEDTETIRTLFLEYQKELGVSLCFQGFDQELATLPGAYAGPRGALLLLKAGAAVAGCVGLRPLDDERAEMKRLYIRPEFRGQGGGRKLAEAVISGARRTGYHTLCLDTLPQMTEAHALYASLGFREIPAYYANPLAGVRYCALELAPPIARAG